MVVSRKNYYKNSSTLYHLTWFLYYRSTAFPTQIFRKLLFVGYLDYVLLPVMVIFLGLVGFALWRSARGTRGV